MATETPYTEQRQCTLPRTVDISAKIPTPFHQEVPRNTAQIVKIRAKYYNLWFDGKGCERFIMEVENIAETEGARERDIARQIAFCTKDEEIGYHIDRIPRYETANDNQLKLDMKRRWGAVFP
ncbi:hypothetical protein O181_008705 [Austropuccinia psidii MF-1]|uniref:Uncharacterized protein n=1 Tax=Austropuccinia psidii MF-1 TaxID=1389203 RepID=A0A9Q3BQG5_9BASI|nr:hypothetical protein [Austropuccinia psidii MF-1]